MDHSLISQPFFNIMEILVPQIEPYLEGFVCEMAKFRDKHLKKTHQPWLSSPYTRSILLRQYYWYQWFNKGFLHQYRPYTINNFVQWGKIFIYFATCQSASFYINRCQTWSIHGLWRKMRYDDVDEKISETSVSLCCHTITRFSIFLDSSTESANRGRLRLELCSRLV